MQLSSAQSDDLGPGPVGNTGSRWRLRAIGRELRERALGSPASVALIDQVIVSGTRYAATLIIGNTCGPAGLGIYQLAFAVVVAVGLTQEALLAKPYQVFARQLVDSDKRVYSGSVLMQHFGLVVTILVATVATLLVLAVGHIGSPDEWRVIFALAVALPGTLVWEFVRRFTLAQMRMWAAVAIDGTVAVAQTTSLLALRFWGGLSVARAILVVGVSGLVVGGMALLRMRRQFVVDRDSILPDLNRNWGYGKWMFAGQGVGLLQAYTVPVLLTWSIGAEATGLVAACQTLVLLSNPLLLGVANWLGPAAAQAYVEGGMVRVSALTIRSTVLLASMMVVFWIVLVFAGEPLLVLAFGKEYAGYGYIVGITGASAVGFGASIGAASGLAAIHRPQAILWGTAAGALVSLACFFPLTRMWGLSGAAWSLVIGSVTTAVVQFLCFLHVQSERPTGTAEPASHK